MTNDMPYVGPRLDAKERRKIAERLSKPRPQSAIVLHHRNMKKAIRVSPNVSAERLKRGDVSADKAIVKSHDLPGQLTGKFWEEGRGKKWADDNDGYDVVLPGQEKSVVAIEGRLHNTQVGSKTAKARPDSPFKRKGAKPVVIVVKGR